MDNERHIYQGYSADTVRNDAMLYEYATVAVLVLFLNVERHK
jgi:hypothetical protein